MTFKCANCGRMTDQPVQIYNHPESPLWCEECAYREIPDYRAFVDSMEPPKRYGFNGATKLLNINLEREAFHHWCGRMVNLGKAHTERQWKEYRRLFRVEQQWLLMLQRAEDAADEYNTQQDAVAPPW